MPPSTTSPASGEGKVFIFITTNKMQLAGQLHSFFQLFYGLLEGRNFRCQLLNKNIFVIHIPCLPSYPQGRKTFLSLLQKIL